MINITVQSVLALGLALLFVSAGSHKLRSAARFHAQLAEYQLIPQGLVSPGGYLLAALELLLAPALLLPPTRPYAGLVAAGLLGLYGIAIAINLARGRDYIDCGCGDTPQLLSPWLLVRNGLLAGSALLTTLPAPTTGFAWSDLLIAVPAFLVVCLVYLVAEQLLENASVLREWSQLRD